MTENEVEDKLTSFITVFKYIDDKDVFQKVNNHTEDHYTFIFPLGEYFCYARKSELLLFLTVVLCQNVGKKAYTWFIDVHGLRRSYD